MSSRRPPAPRKRFGQNFLANPSLAEALVSAFDPRENEVVVEIGPGRGALTRKLAASGARLVALELDERLLGGLEQLLAPFPNATLRHADALETDWDALSEELGAPLRVIGNLPYNVGTGIVTALVRSDALVDLQVVLQREVTERILATEGSRAYGSLSVLCALRCSRRRIRVLPPGAFSPPPKVHSAAIELRLLPEGERLPREEIPALERWVRRGFAQRRKMLASNLVEERALVRAFLAEQGLREDARAEALPAGVWQALVRQLEAPR